MIKNINDDNDEQPEECVTEFGREPVSGNSYPTRFNQISVSTVVQVHEDNNNAEFIRQPPSTVKSSNTGQEFEMKVINNDNNKEQLTNQSGKEPLYPLPTQPKPDEIDINMPSTSHPHPDLTRVRISKL